MNEAPITELAQRHAQWLMARQTAVANNVAHATSPGYRARDVASFSDTLEKTGLSMSVSSPQHFSAGSDRPGNVKMSYSKSPETSHSGNTVSMDQQLLIANEVRQGYALNSGLMRSVHRLILSAAKV